MKEIIEAIDRALINLDYALVVEDSEQFIVRVRRELLNAKIDLQIMQDAKASTELPPLENTETPEKYRKEKPKFVKLTEKQIAQSQSASKRTGHPTPAGVKCPKCGAPPLHKCAKVSMRGGGNDPLGSPIAGYHPERQKEARK